MEVERVCRFGDSFSHRPPCIHIRRRASSAGVTSMESGHEDGEADVEKKGGGEREWG